MDSDLLKHPGYPYGFQEDLILRFELNSSEKMILCSRDTVATYKLSNSSLECDAIFDQSYAATISDLHAGIASSPYTKVSSIHCQTLIKD